MDAPIHPFKIDQRLRAVVVDRLKTSAAHWRNLKLYLSVIGALFVGVAQIWIANSQGEASDLQTAMWIVGVLMFVAVTVLQFRDENVGDDVLAAAEEALNERDDLSKRAAMLEGGLLTLDARLRFVSRLYQNHVVFAESVETILVEGGDRQTLVQFSAKLLELLLQDKQTLFGIDGDENWNIAIYLVDPKTAELECLVCRRANKFEESQAHRRWKSGDGHVGTAFQNRKELVCEDTQEPNVAAFFDAPPDSRRDYDSTRYRSIASIPVLAGARGCVGVVVATSNRAGRFRPLGQSKSEETDTVEPVRLLAKTIALIESANYIRSKGEQNGGE
jgi:hypothetical protein